MVDTLLLQIAKTAILEHFSASYQIDRDGLLQKYPYLNHPGASFVTLHSNHNLRGCIGSIVPHRILLDDLISNAQSAAFRDSRFAPLSREELSSLTLEVSLLSEPKIVEYSDYEDLLHKIRPHYDGLILQHNQYQGTFLPQVWEELPTREAFLEHLSYKAGASPSIYEQHPAIYSYQVDAKEEKFDAILSL